MQAPGRTSEQQQQQQQQQQGSGMGLPTQPGRDGPFQLPPRLRKARARSWFRGYHAQEVEGSPGSFAFQVNFSYWVSIQRGLGT